ncbi:MAG: hypothetical protein PWQ42_804, partial [Sulfurospirillum sp.]|nr:hypothetical protein [Sulfurospirillum sp.]
RVINICIGIYGRCVGDTPYKCCRFFRNFPIFDKSFQIFQKIHINKIGR